MAFVIVQYLVWHILKNFAYHFPCSMGSVNLVGLSHVSCCSTLLVSSVSCVARMKNYPCFWKYGVLGLD